MFKIFKCRRSSIALIAMLLLTFLGIQIHADVSGAIATIVLAVAAANSAEAISTKKKKDEQS